MTDALTDVTVKNYNVDEKTNFFWIWDGGDYTGLPSNGKNSFGWEESLPAFRLLATAHGAALAMPHRALAKTSQ